MLGVIEHNQTDLGPLLTQVGASVSVVRIISVPECFGNGGTFEMISLNSLKPQGKSSTNPEI